MEFKCGDIVTKNTSGIDNTVDLVEHDEDFARVFLKEAQLILNKMRDGHPGLRKKSEETVAHYFSLVFD